MLRSKQVTASSWEVSDDSGKVVGYVRRVPGGHVAIPATTPGTSTGETFNTFADAAYALEIRTADPDPIGNTRFDLLEVD